MAVITWQNDPLLFDVNCTPMNAWMTANKLIEFGASEKIFLESDKLLLSLFPILIRKIDFVRETDKDRILARFPFKVLTEEERELIHDKDLLIAEVARDYFYRSLTLDVLSWRASIRHYLERGAMPYPLVRCAWQIIPRNEPEETFLAFENAKGKRYRVPQQLSLRLAYLCGVCNGDGHLNEHWMRIVDETREHIENLSHLFQELFQDAGRVFFFGNAWNVELSVSSAIRLINFLTDQSINMPKYAALREPLLFQHLGNAFRSSYWRGAMDADGSYTKTITLGSASANYIADFKVFLAENGIPSKIIKTKQDASILYIAAKNNLEFARKIGVTNPKKQKDLFYLLNRQRTPSVFKGVNNDTLTFDGYFNFTLLPEIQIIGLDQFLNSLRNGRTYSTMRELLELSNGSFHHYENGSRAMPLKLLEKIIITEHSSKTLMQLLEELSANILYRSSTSAAITLPVKPSSSLLTTLAYLAPKETYTSIHTKDDSILSSLTRQFKILFKPPQIFNRLFTHYLKTFFHYEKQSYTVPIEDFKLMENDWKKELGSDSFL